MWLTLRVCMCGGADKYVKDAEAKTLADAVRANPQLVQFSFEGELRGW